MRVLLEDLAFPEGPAFAPDGSLWCVELHGGALRAAAGQRIDTGGRPNGLKFDAAGRAVFCDSGLNAIRVWTESHSSTLADGLFGPNDLCFDAAGTLLFTCPGDSRREPTGYVCALYPNGRLIRVREGLYFPNGIALRESTLIVAETYRQRLWKGVWTGDEWQQPAPWASVGGPVGPDGMAFDSRGNLWVAVYGSGKIKVVSPEGEIVQELDAGGPNPTNVAFDPSGALGLVVTEAGHGRLLAFEEIPY